MDKPTQGNFIPLADSNLKLERRPLLEIPAGRGAYRVCQLGLVSKFERVPMAATLLARALQYWDRRPPKAWPRVAVLAEPGSGFAEDRGDYFWQWQLVTVSEMPDTFPTRLQALRIGGVGLVGLPGEIFVEIGLQIKERSPFPVTMPIELANGYLGYTCTDKALLEGSYETQTATSSLPAAGTEALHVETSSELLAQLAGSPPLTGTRRGTPR